MLCSGQTKLTTLDKIDAAMQGVEISLSIRLANCYLMQMKFYDWCQHISTIIQPIKSNI